MMSDQSSSEILLRLYVYEKLSQVGWMSDEPVDVAGWRQQLLQMRQAGFLALMYVCLSSSLY